MLDGVTTPEGFEAAKCFIVRQAGEQGASAQPGKPAGRRPRLDVGKQDPAVRSLSGIAASRRRLLSECATDPGGRLREGIGDLLPQYPPSKHFIRRAAGTGNSSELL